MKYSKNNRAIERLNVLDRNSEGEYVDFSKSLIGIRVIDNNVTIYAFGQKFEDAEYTALKIDYNDVATEVAFRDFAFVGDRINELDFNAVLSIDGINMNINSSDPYDYDMRLLLVFRTPELVVKIILYNAFKLAPGLSGCHVSIGVEGINYHNVCEELAATLSVMHHDTAELLDQYTINRVLEISEN